jgi:hypothetical protein
MNALGYRHSAIGKTSEGFLADGRLPIADCRGE